MSPFPGWGQGNRATGTGMGGRWDGGGHQGSGGHWDTLVSGWQRAHGWVGGGHGDGWALGCLLGWVGFRMVIARVDIGITVGTGMGRH